MTGPLAPGLRAVTDYYERAGLTPVDKLGFGLVGCDRTTCVGNSGQPIPPASAVVTEHDVTVCPVLSDIGNFEGRIHVECWMNLLTLPQLVIACALAGTMHADLLGKPFGAGGEEEAVYQCEIWPSTREVKDVVGRCLQADLFTTGADVLVGDRWRSLDVPGGDRFAWDEASTYVRRAPYFDGMPREPERLRDITGTRVLTLLGDSVTTDHICPDGAIKMYSRRRCLPDWTRCRAARLQRRRLRG